MKRVFTNPSDVIHLFANKVQSDARTGNVFFKNENIYSYGYHYKLAEHLKGGAILINDRGYSVTTSKHISAMADSARHLTRFYVSDVILSDAVYFVKSNVVKIPRARQNKEYLISSVLRKIRKFEEFQEYTKRNKITRLTTGNHDNKKVLIDKRCTEYKYLQRVKNNLLNNYESFISDIKEQKDKDRKKEINNFYKYKSNRISNLKNELLRVSKCGQYVQTSQHVKVDINEVKALLHAIKTGRNVHGQKIGYYTITSYNGKALNIGCHSILKSEINKIGKQLKI